MSSRIYGNLYQLVRASVDGQEARVYFDGNLHTRFLWKCYCGSKQSIDLEDLCRSLWSKKVELLYFVGKFFGILARRRKQGGYVK